MTYHGNFSFLAFLSYRVEYFFRQCQSIKRISIDLESKHGLTIVATDMYQNVNSFPNCIPHMYSFDRSDGM